jgi:hypothetical protein
MHHQSYIAVWVAGWRSWVQTGLVPCMRTQWLAHSQYMISRDLLN